MECSSCRAHLDRRHAVEFEGNYLVVCPVCSSPEQVPTEGAAARLPDCHGE
jgi:hypothetical protein